ncbi:hypothetical protein F0562_001216 [Nyssa sinensis]|uniref:Uncharacterized protein n=1 Tax=Nyssa sinensis TaxID=561372 RepID=A0A5J5C473_9ASTE|nr:hypothetical protein F0562_001216 [Nyssa sinensis]
MSITTATRRPRWHPTPPPPPSPKILNLPRRHRRKQPKNAPKPPLSVADPELRGNYKGRLENLFDQERTFSRTVPIVLLNSGGGGDTERRERVEECEENGAFVEEKWRFQAEILRAECNFLRIEREFALKKLERNRVQMERTLRSAVQTLVSGRKKIYDGKSIGAVLEEEIKDLAEKLQELQKSSGVKDVEVRNCSNFDKKASFLQRRLEKLGGLSYDKCVKEIQEMAEGSLSIHTSHKVHVESFASSHKSIIKLTDDVQVDTLRRKMEGLSKGMLLERMEEEYWSMLSTTANSSIASSASNSKRIENPDSSTRQPYQESESMSNEESKCSGRCKAIVQRIIEQVRAETEQWSQMQEMLGQVREEMGELQASRDFWEDKALDADYEIQSLCSNVQEWRQKALKFETKANELQTEISVVKGELEKWRREQNKEVMPTKHLPPISLGKQIEMEKHVLICHLKENHHSNDKGSKKEVIYDGRRKAHTLNNGLDAQKRSPFRDIGNSSPLLRQSSKAIIGNSSPLVRQNSKAIFPLHCPEPSKTEEIF